ncbi:MAG: hypothetical protein ASARMPREDX12_000911 [Alectoria sarmentosa]|nr:MAG: hypothetical protein ASARMPREDX12_000911 [Alectoria sarmentosa]
MKIAAVPKPGEWPIDPQTDVKISKHRIWVDGCFDFAHHGHAGALLQARRLGNELWVGIHSDEEIMENKGPTVMTLKERVAAVDACRWSTKSVPYAPYVTSLPWISHYGCQYVVHGDDITSDSSGEDCYRYVKAASRFLVVKRTPGISTTDLVGRMLLCTKNHFIRSPLKALTGEEGSESPVERKRLGDEMSQRIRDYATDETGLQPGPQVLSWAGSRAAMEDHASEERGTFRTLANGKTPHHGQRIIYVDGGFDLFSSGHIEFLRQVAIAEEAIGHENGWYEDSSKDYGPAYIVVGVHDDEVINHWKVSSEKYVDSVIFSAPFTPSKAYLMNIPYGIPDAVYHGPTSFMPLTYDPYTAAKALGVYHEIGNHDFQNVNAGEIVQRILKSREIYEERQRAKGEKAATEEAVQRREAMEQEASRLEKDRAANSVLVFMP